PRMPAAPATAAAAPAAVRVATAAIDHPGLSAAPIGSGAIVDAAVASEAKALTQITAKWEWARVAVDARPDASATPSRHLVRLSARRAVPGVLQTPAAIAREVALLTGIPVTAAHVVDVVVQDWPDAVTAAAPDSAAVEREQGRGIHRAGAAVAGTGLASVIPHARDLAVRLDADLAASAPHASHASAAPTRSHA
ncbi:hypothetical protein J0P97_03695, partial [Microbacterium flavum]|nr:hypothetical protein [Microbacterium flavum]